MLCFDLPLLTLVLCDTLIAPSLLGGSDFSISFFWRSFIKNDWVICWSVTSVLLVFTEFSSVSVNMAASKLKGVPRGCSSAIILAPNGSLCRKKCQLASSDTRNLYFFYFGRRGRCFCSKNTRHALYFKIKLIKIFRSPPFVSYIKSRRYTPKAQDHFLFILI